MAVRNIAVTDTLETFRTEFNDLAALARARHASGRLLHGVLHVWPVGVHVVDASLDSSE